ncbi:MAG TPA: chromate transporter [Caulobacteraceae bacterium]|jgi:chromate transporter|nr:chromate transporter [Caulobacteraceae bacterium]
MKGLGVTLGLLAVHFAALSLLAFGGANTIVPEIHRNAVEVRHWMDDRDFANIFAIAQAAPGPNAMITTLVGLKAAGIAGALVATIAFCLPAGLLVYVVVGVWDRIQDSPWRTAVQAGLGPVTVGLVAASAFLLTRAADRGVGFALVTAATAAFSYFTRLNPLWALGAAALLGGLGLVR